MTNFIVCLSCLTSDVKMFSFRNTLLPEIYEKLANIKLFEDDGIPETICYICYSQLQKCYEFMNMSQKAGKILTQLLKDGIQLSQETVSVLDERTTNSLVTTILKPISVPYLNDEFTNEKTDEVSSVNEIINATDEGAYVSQVFVTLKEEPMQSDEQMAVEEEIVTVKEEPVDIEIEPLAEHEHTLVTEGNAMLKKERECSIMDLKAAVQSDIEGNTMSAQGAYTSKVNDNNFLTGTQHQTELKLEHRCVLQGKYTKKTDKKVKSQNKNHACNTCDMKFTCKYYLTRHLRVHTGEKPFACNSCDKTFSQNCHLAQHMKSHHTPKVNKDNLQTGKIKYTKKTIKKPKSKEKTHVCNTCEIKFSNQYYLMRHLRVHTGEKPFACSSCDKSFSQNCHLAQHMRSHTGEKPYVCNTCDKAFNRRNNFITHVKRHSEITLHMCGVCNKALSNKGDLKRHMMIHTGERPYACKICDKSFSQSGHLSQHTRLHTGEKPYACAFCERAFSQKNDLKYHLSIHTGEKLFPCTFQDCSKSFSTKFTLTNHVRVHTGERPYGCEKCHKTYKQKGHLTKHISMVHDKDQDLEPNQDGSQHMQAQLLQNQVDLQLVLQQHEEEYVIP